MYGVLLVDKPTGLTSHDVVDEVRALTGERRVGHAGTLDPLASGVLVVLVGRRATRLQARFLNHDKAYSGTMRFGLVTASQDREGEVLSTADASGLTKTDVEGAFRQFTGTLQQLPPMASAVKVKGKPLYAYHRRGQQVEREPRQIEVISLELAAFRPGPAAEAEFRSQVSKGTYLRTLCHDIGQALGVGATLQALCRTRSGPFSLERCYRLGALKAGSRSELAECLLDPEELVA